MDQPGKEPNRQTLDIAQAEHEIRTLLDKVQRKGTRIVFEKDGTPVAAIISVRDLERFELLERERKRAFSVVHEIRAAFADVPDEVLEQDVNRAVEEARRQARENREAIDPK